MQPMIKSAIFLLFLLLCLASCTEKKEHLEEKEFKQKFGEQLVKTNKYLVKKDQEAIESYVKRHNWNMQVTGSGLYYEVYFKGSGNKAETGNQATINYKISLLDGTVCYSSETRGPKTFRISQGGVESGLEEGILMLNTGSKARFIMPPHLAHGLVGDDDKIPPRSIIVYDVELVKIQG